MRRLVLIIFVITLSLFSLMTLSETTPFTIPFNYLSQLSQITAVPLTASTVQETSTNFETSHLVVIFLLAVILLSGVYVHYHKILQKENYLPNYGPKPDEPLHGKIIRQFSFKSRPSVPIKKSTVVIPMKTSAYDQELKVIDDKLKCLPPSSRVSKTDLLKRLDEVEGQLVKLK